MDSIDFLCVLCNGSSRGMPIPAHNEKIMFFNKQVIMLCLFPQDLNNLNHIFEFQVGSDMTKEEFRQLCMAAWEKQYRFVIIDLSSKNTMVNIEVGLTSFTYQTKLKTKQILFSNYKMEKLLKQIANNTEPKRSFSIVVSDNKTRLKHGSNDLFNLIKRDIM